MTLRSVAVVVVGVLARDRPRLERDGFPFLARLLQDELDGLADLLQLRVAEAGEGHSLLEELELFLQTELVGFDLRDDRFEALHRLLEAALLPRNTRGHGLSSVASEKSGPKSSSAGRGGRGSGVPRTIARSSPSWRRTRIGSPGRTDAAERSGDFVPSR